jgi:hypothetical protein
MSSMSEFEIQAVKEEQARIKKEAIRKFFDFRRSTQGEVACRFR